MIDRLTGPRLVLAASLLLGGGGVNGVIPVNRVEQQDGGGGLNSLSADIPKDRLARIWGLPAAGMVRMVDEADGTRTCQRYVTDGKGGGRWMSLYPLDRLPDGRMYDPATGTWLDDVPDTTKECLSSFRVVGVAMEHPVWNPKEGVWDVFVCTTDTNGQGCQTRMQVPGGEGDSEEDVMRRAYEAVAKAEEYFDAGYQYEQGK